MQIKCKSQILCTVLLQFKLWSVFRVALSVGWRGTRRRNDCLALLNLVVREETLSKNMRVVLIRQNLKEMKGIKIERKMEYTIINMA